VHSGDRLERRRTEVEEEVLRKDAWDVGREEFGC